jgi:hypothetical protein
MRQICTYSSLAACFIIVQIHAEAVAQSCNLNHKSISTTVNICLSTGCQRSEQTLRIIDDKILAHDENLDTGRIYYIGRTVDATSDDNQKGGSTLRMPGARSFKVLLSATYAGNRLVVKNEESVVWPESPIPTTVVIVETYNIVGCYACSGDYLFDARLNSGRTERKQVIFSRCSIADF